MGKLIKILVFIISIHSSFAQTVVNGRIFEKDGEAIPGVSIILKDSLGKIAAYVYSDNKGYFKIESSGKGKYTLEVSSLGFKKEVISVYTQLDIEKPIYEIYLEQEEVRLEPVEIKYVIPIRESGNSVIFNADSFIQGNEQVLEDLLKKLPGFNIDSDGTIKFQNKEIESLMIEGDDVLGGAYSILSKNMPVNPVDKVEVLQRYSRNKHLKGLENSDKVAMNIKLKEDYKRNWFGNLQLGVANQNKLELRSNLMNFGAKSKYYALGTFNNIGKSPQGDISNLTKTSGTSSKFGEDISSNQLINLKQSTPNLNPERINLNQTGLISLNGIFNLSDKSRLRLIGVLSDDKKEFFKNQTQSYKIGNERFENLEVFQSVGKNILGLGQINFTFDPSSFQTLEISSKINKTNSSDKNLIDFNKYQLIESLIGYQTLLDQQITFTRQIGEKQTIIFDVRNINETSPQDYTVNQSVFNRLFEINADKVLQQNQYDIHFLGGEISYFKKSNYLLEIRLGNRSRTDKLKTDFGLQENNKLFLPEGYQNNIRYSTNDLYLSSKTSFKLNQLNFNTGIELHSEGSIYINFSEKKINRPLYFNPSVGFKWNNGNKNKISVSYAYNNSVIKITDIYGNFILTGFKTLSGGLDDLKNLHYSNLIINHNYGKLTDKFNFSGFLLYNRFHNSITTNSIVLPEFTQSQKIDGKTRGMLSAISNFNYFLQAIRSNLKLNLTYNQLNFNNQVNQSAIREIFNQNFNYGLELRSGFLGKFNFHLGHEFKNSRLKSDDFSKSFIDNSSFIDLGYELNNRFNVYLQGERYYFASLQQSAYYFMDLESRYIVKENKLNFYLSAKNLFNTKTFRVYNLTDISSIQTEYRLQPRYIMLKLELRF